MDLNWLKQFFKPSKMPTGQDFTRMSGIGIKPGPNANAPLDEQELRRIASTMPSNNLYDMAPMDQIGIAQEYIEPGLSQDPLGFLGLDMPQVQMPPRVLANANQDATVEPAKEASPFKGVSPEAEKSASMFRKEKKVSDAEKELDFDAEEPEDEFVKAQRLSDTMEAIGMGTRAAHKFASAWAGVQADPDFLKDFMASTGKPVKNLLQSRQAAAEKMQLDDTKRKYAFEKDKDDPNSVMSTLYRDTLKEFGNTVPAMKGVLDKIPENVSAAELEKLSPTLFNLISAQVAREGRLEAAKLAAQEKADKREEQKKDDLFNKETKLRAEIKAADKETAYSQTKMAYDDLKSAFKEGRWGGLQDVAAVYGFIKALDPGSVVRETETELVLSAESPLVRFANFPAKIARGDLASPSFRKKLLSAFENLEKTRRKQFEFKTAGTRQSIKSYGLDAKNIEMQELGVTTDGKEEPTTVVVREKASGRMKRLDEATARKVLANPGYEEVK